jgi:putative DNA primase/helicase
MTTQPPHSAAGQDRAPLPKINFSALADALLSRASTLVPEWLHGGKMQGLEYFVHSPWRSEKTPSMSVRMSGENAGKWSDHGGTARGGDLLSLYKEIFGLEDMAAAAIEVAHKYGLEQVCNIMTPRPGAMPVRTLPEPAPAKENAKIAESWKTISPAPEYAPEPNFYHHARRPADIAHLARYEVDGRLYGFVVRFKKSDGGKKTLPHTWCTSARDGTSKWHWRAWDGMRPLYFPNRVSPAQRTVVVVEGERKADVLQKVLDIVAPDIYTVAGWVGGCKAWDKAEWSWLAGCNVLLWPDCDGKREQLPKKDADACPDSFALELAKASMPVLPAHKQGGMKAMLGIGALLRDKHGCKVQMLKIPEPLEVPDGWDCADAIETDGWDGERVLAFFGTAYVLPAGDGEKPATAATGGSGQGNGGGKKIDGPVDTESDGSDDEGFETIGGHRVPNWLAWYYNRKDKKWLTSRKMVIAILEKDPILEPILAYNELSNNVQSRELWPWAYAEKGDVTDAVDLLLGKYLTDTYGLPSIPRAALSEAIQTVAHSRRFHPIREYLEGLPAHDLEHGKSRIDNWLVHVLGESPDSLSPAMLEYLQLVGRFLLLGMVYRVMQPGCKFDYCPVLEGRGGLRKSTMVEILATSAFFSDTKFDVGRGKEGQEQVQGLWLYEIAELSNFGKAEVGDIKAFISSKVDRYRVAYGTTVGRFPRQCVLVGTTNLNTYLRDRTGNRRFWPVPVKHVINTEWLQKYRDVLLAEAYALYKTGVVYFPSDEQERRLFKPMQDSRLIETPLMGKLMQIFMREPKLLGSAALINIDTNFATLSQIVEALETDAYKSSPSQDATIRDWMASEGWISKKKMVNNYRAWGWERPDNWPSLDDHHDLEEMMASPQPSPQTPTTQDDDDVPF